MYPACSLPIVSGRRKWLTTKRSIPKKRQASRSHGPDTDSCAEWAAERAKSGYHSQAQEGWIFGYITGLNAFGQNSGDNAPGTTAAGLIGWVDNYCKANPLDAVNMAGFDLANELI